MDNLKRELSPTNNGEGRGGPGDQIPPSVVDPGPRVPKGGSQSKPYVYICRGEHPSAYPEITMPSHGLRVRRKNAFLWQSSSRLSAGLLSAPDLVAISCADLVHLSCADRTRSVADSRGWSISVSAILTCLMEPSSCHRFLHLPALSMTRRLFLLAGLSAKDIDILGASPTETDQHQKRTSSGMVACERHRGSSPLYEPESHRVAPR